MNQQPLNPAISQTMAAQKLPTPIHGLTTEADMVLLIDKKAREELAKKAGGKGPMNTGQQGIKKSGKK